MLQIKNCDIFESGADAIIHCANCFNVFGAGIAKAIAEKCPEAEKIDETTIKGDKSKLGSISVAQTHYKTIKLVFNVYGQFDYGPKNKRYLNYEAFYRGLEKVNDYIVGRNKNLEESKKTKSLAAPYGIGCGLAGGNWDIVEVMLKTAFMWQKEYQFFVCKIA